MLTFRLFVDDQNELVHCKVIQIFENGFAWLHVAVICDHLFSICDLEPHFLKIIPMQVQRIQKLKMTDLNMKCFAVLSWQQIVDECRCILKTPEILQELQLTRGITALLRYVLYFFRFIFTRYGILTLKRCVFSTILNVK